MDELLKKTGYQLRGLKRGDVLEGIITEKARKAIYIDVGAKTEGIVFEKELKLIRDFVDQLQVGDKIEVVVGQPESESGQLVLSLKRAAFNHSWQYFIERLKTEKHLTVVGREMNKGGLIVGALGLQGFIPASQFSSSMASKIKNLMGQSIRVKVIEVDREKNRLIFSEKAVSEAAMLQAQKEALEELKISSEYEAEITGVMPFGFFVRINLESKKKEGNVKTYFEGLVHISEISWEKVDDSKKYGKVGDKIKVKLLAIDRESGKLNLSQKRLVKDPWDDLDKRYPKDAPIEGTVSRVAPFGVFVKLEPGIEGLIHISKMPSGANPQPDEKISCFVDAIDMENRHLSLGMILKEKPVGYK